MWRALSAAALAFAAGTAGLFYAVHQRGTGINYPATKFILQYQWFAYLAAAMLLAAIRRKTLLLAAAIVILVLSRDLSKTGLHFVRHLREDSRPALFTEADGLDCRAALGPDPAVYVATPEYHENFKIVGKFLAFGSDLFSHNGSWPGNDPKGYDGTQKVVLVGGRSKLSDDKSLPPGLVPVLQKPDLAVLAPVQSLRNRTHLR